MLNEHRMRISIPRITNAKIRQKTRITNITRRIPQITIAVTGGHEDTMNITRWSIEMIDLRILCTLKSMIEMETLEKWTKSELANEKVN